ncbi:MAG: hypothetical protein J6P60_06090, partial [Lachnospiraceae bacterium]|nr:hypothetical protein [Lachnospiraceae bacterium]
VSGIVTSTGRDGLEQLKQKYGQLAGSIRESIGMEVSIQYVHTAKHDPKQEVTRGETDENIDSRDLYKIAKCFIMTIRQSN